MFRPPLNPANVIRIEALELPTSHDIGEGDYVLQFGDRPKEKFYHDIISLKKFLGTIQNLPKKVDDLLDYLQNFKKVFINLDTGEVSS